MDAKTLIRKPLAAALLGATFVAVPAGALFLYSSEHSAEAAAAVPESAPGVARRPRRRRSRRSRAGCPIFARSCSATDLRSSTSA